jgi:hypothetical protein
VPHSGPVLNQGKICGKPFAALLPTTATGMHKHVANAGTGRAKDRAFNSILLLNAAQSGDDDFSLQQIVDFWASHG